jgi:alkylhydroperoxidase family enzyme
MVATTAWRLTAWGRENGEAAGRRDYSRSEGHASDPKRDAAVQFARKVIEARGQVNDADVKAIRDAGYTDANVMEIVALVAMYSLTNFFSNCSIPRRIIPPLRRLA